MSIQPNLVSCGSLETAWSQAFKLTLADKEVAPLVVTFSVPESQGAEENARVQAKLDETVESHGMFSCSTVANTIFPFSLWDHMKEPERLYSAYFRMLPVLWKYPQNRRGLYFERLVDYDNDKKPGTGVNQLRHVIETWHRGNHRRSGLQAAIFDPRRDHINSPYLGFPCLHQVAFVPLGSTRLAIVGYYGRQYIVEKAFGNYMGLTRLGHFMAHQMGLQLERVTIVAGVASLGPGIRKAGLQELVALVDSAATLN